MNNPQKTLSDATRRDLLRLKINNVLLLCMEDSSVIPLQKLVEKLIVAGPEAVIILQEMLSETYLRKAQVEDDQNQIFQGFKTNLESYGVTLTAARKPYSLIRLKPIRFSEMVIRQGIKDAEQVGQCMQLFHDSKDLLINLHLKLELLERIEDYLEDWTWAVFYLTTRNSHNQIH